MTEGGGGGVKFGSNLCVIINEWPLTNKKIHIKLRPSLVQLCETNSTFFQGQKKHRKNEKAKLPDKKMPLKIIEHKLT